jgi:hypothetical protein
MKGFIICSKTCLAMDKTLITSVLGFDLKAEIVDLNGQAIRTGCKGCINPRKKSRIKSRILDKKFFTNYNEALLAKIRDLRSNI